MSQYKDNTVMKVLVYNAKPYEKFYLNKLNEHHQLSFIEQTLSSQTVHLSQGYEGVCCFVTDDLSASVIEKLSANKVKLISLRSAGYDHVDLEAARKNQISVVRVPKYSPQAVAEFAVTLILTLSRKIITAYLQGLEFDYSLDHLMGFNLYQKTVGIIGLGNIGSVFAKILQGFDCRVLGYDLIQTEECKRLGVNYVSLDELLQQSDIVSLHCPLNPSTQHIINKDSLSLMKPGSMLINTGRGGLVNTQDLLEALDKGQLNYAGLDVYEKEKGLFFIDHHGKAVDDPLFLKLRKYPQVLVTPHQAFFTEEAVTNIMQTTLENISSFEQGHLINSL
jgi:D-lactate dehydrogenase